MVRCVAAVLTAIMAALIAGKRRLTRIVMMAITTRSSMSVNPRPAVLPAPGVRFMALALSISRLRGQFQLKTSSQYGA